MEIDQHIYTSGKNGFETISSTGGLGENEIQKLETFSLYLLPSSILYKESIPKPIKYVFYPLSEEKFVIGKAVYSGKDNFGRMGNYLFHNFVISKEDFLEIEFNPGKFIKWAETKRIFRDKISNEPFTKISFSPDEIKTINFEIQNIKKDVILNILYFCFNYKIIRENLLLLGENDKFLNFLILIYSILPLNLRKEISFDTYAYKSNLDAKIMGLPDKKEFKENQFYSLKVNLSTMDFTSNIHIKEIPENISFITDMVVSGKIKEINSLHLLEYYFKNENYEKIKSLYKNTTPQIRNHFLKKHKEEIVNTLITKKLDIPTFSLDIGIIQEFIEEKKHNNKQRIEELNQRITNNTDAINRNSQKLQKIIQEIELLKGKRSRKSQYLQTEIDLKKDIFWVSLWWASISFLFLFLLFITFHFHPSLPQESTIPNKIITFFTNLKSHWEKLKFYPKWWLGIISSPIYVAMLFFSVKKLFSAVKQLKENKEIQRQKQNIENEIQTLQQKIDSERNFQEQIRKIIEKLKTQNSQLQNELNSLNEEINFLNQISQSI